MGFELGALIGGPLPPERILPVTRALLDRWPWLRVPSTSAHPQHVLLGSVERTSYLVGAPFLAQLLDATIEQGLVELSGELPECTFAWIHTDCFAGLCVEDGLVARAGQRLATSTSLPELLAAVGITSTGFFAAFERDHFGANVDPRRFVDRLPPNLRVELDEDEADDPDEPELPALPGLTGVAGSQWLASALGLGSARVGLTAVELEVIAALDRDASASEPLHVLADALALAGDPRGELLALDLRLRSDPAQFAPLLRSGFARRQRRAMGQPLEQHLLALDRQQPPHHLRIDEWWPRLWVEFRGPWLIRMVVRSSVFTTHRSEPVGFDLWTPAGFAGLRSLFDLPCARYLSERRVSLLRCPIQPELAGRDLSGAMLDGVDLRGTGLADARLDGTSLRGCSARHAELRGASLVDADLRQADLRQADLRDANLLGADLRGADLGFADLRGARFDPRALASTRSEGARR